MRINGTPPKNHIERATEGKARPAETNTDGRMRESRPTGQSVAVSKLSQKLAAARAAETPDAERVARLRAALADGTLQISSHAIADAMLREER